MIKKTILWILLWPLAGWAQTSSDKPEQWLQYQLKHYFEGSATMQELTTPRYAAFKTDAMNVGFYGGPSYSTFQKRWARIYNIHHPNVHDAFLVPLQDWDSIHTNCELLPLANGEVWIGADMVESPSNKHFRCDIKLVRQNGKWRIDDVLSVVPLHQCITGNFDGNNPQQMLCATLTGHVSRQPILIDTLLPYDTLIARTIAQLPLLQLVGEGLDTLLLNKETAYVLGLHYLANVGDIDGRPGDEVAVVIRAADWSGSNLFNIYTYTPKGWKLYGETEIREEDLPAIAAGKIKPWTRLRKTNRE